MPKATLAGYKRKLQPGVPYWEENEANRKTRWDVFLKHSVFLNHVNRHLFKTLHLRSAIAESENQHRRNSSDLLPSWTHPAPAARGQSGRLTVAVGLHTIRIKSGPDRWGERAEQNAENQVREKKKVHSIFWFVKYKEVTFQRRACWKKHMFESHNSLSPAVETLSSKPGKQPIQHEQLGNAGPGKSCASVESVWCDYSTNTPQGRDLSFLTCRSMAQTQAKIPKTKFIYPLSHLLENQ